MDLQGGRACAPALAQPRRQPRADLGRSGTKEGFTLPVHPYFRCFLIRRIGNQVEGVAGFECTQMAISIGEGGAVDRSSEVRWSAIREGRTVPAHSALLVRVTVLRLWFIR